MAIIPIIFFALIFGVGSLFGSTGEVSMTQEATPELSAPSASAAAVPGTNSGSMPAEVVQSMFDNREPLPPCDTWQCLENSADGDGGELVKVAPTFEGDPITTYYRVRFGTLEVYTDSSQDQYLGTGPAWTYDVCPLPDDVRKGCAGS